MCRGPQTQYETALFAEPVMRLTVCQLPDDPDAFEEAFGVLTDHVRRERTDILLLNEMPASPWLAHAPKFDARLWKSALVAHDEFPKKFGPLGDVVVLGSRPVESGKLRLNQAYLWNKKTGYQPVHDKAYLPDEPGFYEARWFDRGPPQFDPVETKRCAIGFQICTEIMFNEWSRAYGKRGVDLIAVPRASGAASRWPIAMQMAAVASGAFVATSNRTRPSLAPPEATFGGKGMIVDPEGEILATTSDREPFVTVSIDLALAEKAKRTYPRSVLEAPVEKTAAARAR